MGLNIGLHLRTSEGPIRKSKVLVRTSDQKGARGIYLYKQETHVEDSSKAIVTPPSSTKIEADPSKISNKLINI